MSSGDVFLQHGVQPVQPLLHRAEEGLHAYFNGEDRAIFANVGYVTDFTALIQFPLGVVHVFVEEGGVDQIGNV